MSELSEKAVKTTYLSIFGNALLALIKGLTGLFGHSYALIADAIESTVDVFSSILVLMGIKYASKPPDENHPYGHGKAEPLVTFFVVIILVLSAVGIAIKSVENILTPHKIPESYTLYVLAGVIIVKELFYRVLSKRNEETKSTSIEADAWHHRSDAITSLMAFIGISVAIFMGPGYENADDWAALIASGIIIFNAYLIFRPALGEMMDEHIHPVTEGKIRQFAQEITGVIDTEKCYIRKSGIFYQVDLHLIVDGKITVHDGHVIAHEVKDNILLKMPEVLNIHIHIEPD